ncbi:MAG: ubiquinone biosynthesis protein [Gaiellaceae bacterium]|nr:ubiquinone biosynthesis protein [Gaiellaceae bacterium]
MGARLERGRRALAVGRVARRSGVRRVLAEVGLSGSREATREGARAFREGIEELGTTFIKLGQLLSSRPDLLPDVYIEELTRLVDSVPPVPFAEIEAIIHEDLGADAFISIDPEPLATASIAQTHRGLLATGHDVVVKVRRPGVLEQVDLDLALLRSTVRFAAAHSEAAQRIQLEELADELEVHLHAELDFVEEAHNAELIRGLVEKFEGLVVPRVIRPYVSERVLVLERIQGSKVEAAHGLDPERAAELAREFFRAYIHQVVVEGVYHADPHRGNVFVTDDGRLALLDFGLLGRLDEDSRARLALLLLALAQNRADDVADLVISLSTTTMHSDQAGFVQDVRRTLPRFHHRPLASIQAGYALANLQRAAIQRDVRLPTSFALVGKTLSQADSIARLLDPDLDPVALIEEESLEVMAREIEHRLEPNRFAALALTQLAPVLQLPRRISHVVTELEKGTLRIGIVPTNLEELEHNFRSIANRIGAAVIVGSLLLSSSLLVRVVRFEWLGIAGFSLAAVLGLYMVWKIIRTPGEL